MGGKSRICLTKYLPNLEDPNARIAVFRQTHPELLRPGGLIDESHHIYPYLNGQWGSQKKKWTFPSGATISFSAIVSFSIRFFFNISSALFSAFFILFELLNGIAGNQAQFKMIDLRLIFVMLFGSTYGINYGIAAAAAESLSLIRAFEAEGSSWYVLFYEPSNWIPFIFYFAVGAICGYIRMKNRDNVQFIKEENNLATPRGFEPL